MTPFLFAVGGFAVGLIRTGSPRRALVWAIRTLLGAYGILAGIYLLSLAAIAVGWMPEAKNTMFQLDTAVVGLHLLLYGLGIAGSYCLMRGYRVDAQERWALDEKEILCGALCLVLAVIPWLL